MLTLLMVGRSGNGRSSVGNTILGDRNAFKVMGSSEDMSFTHRKQKNEEFVVVDCIGIGDTTFGSGADIRSALCVDTVDARELGHRDVSRSTDVTSGACTLFGNDEDETGQMESFEIVEPDSAPKERELLTTEQNDGEHIEVCNAIVTEVPVFHALIFVMKYGVRFTKQEKDAVQMVKSVFGDNVFKNWGILVFSYGDNFHQDAEDDGTTFERWCREQTGDIRSLFQEVDYRCVIFDNKTRVESKQKEQRQKLNECIEKVREKGNKYTLTQFKEAEYSRIEEKEFKPLQSETEIILREAHEKKMTGENAVDWVVELNVQLGHYLILLTNLEDKGHENGAVAQMCEQLHDQINILNDLLAKEKSREFQVNFSSLQMLDNVKTQLNHLAAYIVSFLNLGSSIKEYFVSFTT